MLTAILTAAKDAASQGITLGTVAVLLVVTFFLLYIPVYAVFIRPRKRKAKERQEGKGAQKEKNIKPKMPEYNQCSLNEIMGYDFIQTQYIGNKDKDETESPAGSAPKSFADSVGIGTTEGQINESVIGVTGRESATPQDEPVESPEDRKKREAQKTAQLEQEKRLKEIEEAKKEIAKDEDSIKLEGDMADLYNTDWPEDAGYSGDEMGSGWAAPYDDRYGEYVDNSDEDADEMNSLADVPKDQESYDKVVEALLFEQDGKGVSSSQETFLERLNFKDEYVSQPHSEPKTTKKLKKEENENPDSE